MHGKKPLDQDAPFQLYCVNSDVNDAGGKSKDAIKYLRAVLELPDFDAGDAPAFRLAISRLEGVVNTLDAVKEELSKTELSKIPMDDGLPPGFGDSHPDDPGPETVIGQVKGKWVVHARVNYHFSAIQVVITGGRNARSGVDTYDRSVTIAGDDWRPLITEAVTEMRFRTGLPVSTEVGDFSFCGIMPRFDFESDEGHDDSEREEIAEELADILEKLADAPLPPRAA
jgi:hypothetical protein